MDALITLAWRTFWVGLGASAVLIAQNLVPAASPRAQTSPPAEATLQAPAGTASVSAPVPMMIRNAS